ncbi:MAG TPA: phosphonate ABC transporter, permease protein PhnE [Bacillota bacterium]|nr:phosphonate ABC transporter, permease protein PhnE [Bacillota bacterium]
MAEYNLPPKTTVSWQKRIKAVFIALAVVALYLWTFLGIDIEWGRAIERISENFGVVIPKLFNPDWAVTREVTAKIMETIFIAFAGTLMASILAVPLGFLAAKNMTHPVIALIGKWLLSANRSFPELILAILFVAAIGPNAFAGVLAIAIHSTGMLGKLYSEVLESIDMQVVEAMEANGANKIQILFHGVLPQVIPEFLSYAIYRFEIDIRASSVLGIVGAGGIGTMIIFASMNRNWNEMGLILLAIIIVVTIIDTLSAKIRQKIV